ncbi:hypothetical protein NVV95_03100 [Herbiconiux sp. CPCC 205716]|uniref:Uncharacterized protein n=1 Tax=Herbiconiux gentiana TaxID=2970912 RepID=A0ABT2GBG0_9MICO|nr:hypothetical protein [Herbiconiux gentiana]MCS5713538.1 hypothetical protein [Herbiconiux gentiana]
MGARITPEKLAKSISIESADDAIEVLVDDGSRLVKASLANNPSEFYAEALLA